MKTSYNLVPQTKDLGEYVPEPLRANKDLLLEEIRRFKLNTQQGTLTDAIRKALNNVEEEILNIEPGRGILRKKRRRKVRGVNPGNILEEKRPRANHDWPKKVVVFEKEELSVNTRKHNLTGLQPLDRVEILTSRFGRAYAKDKPKYTEGIVRKRVGQMVDVLWDGTSDGLTMRSHKSQIKKIGTALPVFCDLSNPMTQMVWPYKSVHTMLPVLEVGSCLSSSDIN